MTQTIQTKIPVDKLDTNDVLAYTPVLGGPVVYVVFELLEPDEISFTGHSLGHPATKQVYYFRLTRGSKFSPGLTRHIKGHWETEVIMKLKPTIPS